jgi:hypothetical protein
MTANSVNGGWMKQNVLKYVHNVLFTVQATNAARGLRSLSTLDLRLRPAYFVALRMPEGRSVSDCFV